MNGESILAVDSLAVPVPQRLNLLVLLAVWLWERILAYSYQHAMDVSTLVVTRPPGDIRPAYSGQQVYKKSHRLSIKLTKIVLPLHLITMALWTLNYITGDHGKASYLFDTLLYIGHRLPLLQSIIIVVIILRTSDVVAYCTKRLLLIESNPSPLRTTYILLSDTLTSFAKPLIDFTLYASYITIGDLQFRHVDLLVAQLPVFVRIFQCLREYSLGGNKMALLNTLKYASSLPILFCMWLMRVHPEHRDSHSGYHRLFMLVNSCYTFFWDVRIDWSMDSFTRIRATRQLTFSEAVYRISVIFDFVVRFWWVWIYLGSQMGYHFDSSMVFDGEIQYLEIIRRAIWVVFRLESDHITRSLAK